MDPWQDGVNARFFVCEKGTQCGDSRARRRGLSAPACCGAPGVACAGKVFAADTFALPPGGVLPYPSGVIQSSPCDADFRFAERCLAGEDAAIAELRAMGTGWVRSFLVHRGAQHEESHTLVETLLTDLLVPTNGASPLIASYLGQSPFRAWLSRVALNRLISFKRAQQRDLRRFGAMPGEKALEALPDDRAESTEEPVLGLLRKAIGYAFEQCEPEGMIMLQLLHVDGLRPEEIGRMFGCVGTTVTRHAERAAASIRAAIMAHIKKRDPWLEIAFDDLLAICQTVLPASLGLS
jgi:DNA-directed RNA polymerase specialized sigma24 family protein